MYKCIYTSMSMSFLYLDFVASVCTLLVLVPWTLVRPSPETWWSTPLGSAGAPPSLSSPRPYFCRLSRTNFASALFTLVLPFVFSPFNLLASSSASDADTSVSLMSFSLGFVPASCRGSAGACPPPCAVLSPEATPSPLGGCLAACCVPLAMFSVSL